jgi:hypothetical protein
MAMSWKFHGPGAPKRRLFRRRKPKIGSPPQYLFVFSLFRRRQSPILAG